MRAQIPAIVHPLLNRLTQGDKKADFKNNTILLDTCSNVSIVKNKDLINGLREDDEGMEIRSNGGGVIKSLEYGYFKDCSNLKVWYNEHFKLFSSHENS